MEKAVIIQQLMDDEKEVQALRDAIKRKDKFIRAFVAYFDQDKTITPVFIEEARKELG